MSRFPILLPFLFSLLLSVVVSQAPCSIPTCALQGQRASCEYLSQTVTCAVYHDQAIQTDPTFCSILCTRECLGGSSRPVASDGRSFCTVCVLQQISCQSGFTITGPIGTAGGLSPSNNIPTGGSPVRTPPPTRPATTATTTTTTAAPTTTTAAPTTTTTAPITTTKAPAVTTVQAGPREPVLISEPGVLLPQPEDESEGESGEPSPSPDDIDIPLSTPDSDRLPLTEVTPAPECEDRTAANCCEDLGISCLTLNDVCTTTGTQLTAAIPCANGLVCVVEDYGFPASDIPTVGRCAEEIPETILQKCSVAYCAFNGKRAICELDDGLATCGAWGTREDGGENPDCAFLCTLGCEVGDERPLGSDGKRYCSICELASVSCRTDFEIYGPVKSA